MAHLDELSMIVERVEDGGTLRVGELGVMNPGNFGLGPVAVLGDAEELAAGVHPGARVCVHRSRREPVRFGQHVGGCFLDDRAAVVVLLEAARRLRERGERPPADVHLVFTTSEEIGGVGASCASRTLPGEVTLALEVGPAEPEHGTVVDPGPVVVCADAGAVYDSGIADHLLRLGQRLDLAPVPAAFTAFTAFESDASQSELEGQSPQAVLLCLPTLSTHGYEVVHRDAVGDLAELLTEHLAHPRP